MRRSVVRIQEIKLNKFKNVKQGTISFNSYNNIKNKVFHNDTDIIGIYGQNGSGKTAVVDSLGILKDMVSGVSINNSVKNLILHDSNECVLEYVFMVEREDDKFLVSYSFEISVNNENSIEISKESISYSKLVDDKWKNKIKIIDYDIEFGVQTFRPKSKYDEVINCNKENIINLGVAKALSKKERKSFIFSEDSLKIFRSSFTGDNLLIVDSLIYFIRLNLFVIKNEYLGAINTNQIMPFSFRIESDEEVSTGEIGIKLFDVSVIDKAKFNVLNKIINQINIVVNAIIPNLRIDIKNYGDQLLEDGAEGIKIELLSVRDKNKVPLKYESDGIKKIVSILSALIAMYNNRTICVVVDELDAGVFEYLLGEILEVIQENAKGQLIFTSHNLRALEKLNKECIVFTTTNPLNRYIKLANVKNNNNLRDFYLRGILLGGQKENIYEETNKFEISYAFKKAGRKINEI